MSQLSLLSNFDKLLNKIKNCRSPLQSYFIQETEKFLDKRDDIQEHNLFKLREVGEEAGVENQDAIPCYLVK